MLHQEGMSRAVKLVKSLKDAVQGQAGGSLSQDSSAGQILKWVHLGAKAGFKLAGYRFEQRRRGDSGIALWRLPLKKLKRGERHRRLVLIPGFGDTALSWYPVLAILIPLIKRHYTEIVLFDYPGFAGFLAQEECLESFDLMLEMTHEVLDDLKPKTIIGHSLGGWVAASYGCLDAPEEKSDSRPELILWAPSGIFGTEEEKKSWEALFARAQSEGLSALRPHMFHREPFLFQWLMGELGSFTTKPDVLKFMKSIREDHRLEEKVSALSSRVTLVWGDHDTLVPSAWMGAWSEVLKKKSKSPEVRSILIKDTGHSPQLERPTVTALVLGQLLTGSDLDRKLTKSLYSVSKTTK